MTEAIHNNYEVSSEGAVRHWEIPYARLTDTTPTPSNPAEVTSLLAATQLSGTILTIDAGDNIAVIDFTAGMVYRHTVRNVLTYNPGVAELTWGAINIGDPIYYDPSASMPVGTYLSTSPLDTSNGANTLFGFAVSMDDTDMALFPKGGAVGSTQTIGVMQIGAGR
jgi:hypothetical protein